jgi:uncharacterized protein (DUF1015 family)
MAHLRPFRALRPNPSFAAQVAAVPYDVVDRDEAARMAEGNALSFLHISRAEIDLPKNSDPYSQTVYDLAKQNLTRLVQNGTLLHEDKPCLYLYRLEVGGHAQTGLAATFSLQEYREGGIRRHELTRKEKEDDRTQHLTTIQAQTGPVFLAYRARAEIDAAAEKIATQKPEVDFVAVDGVRHTIWIIRETGPWVEAFRSVSRLYIADGHHRAASASRIQKRLSAESQPENFEYVMAVAFPSNQLRILPYHRLIKSTLGDPWPAIRERFVVSENASDQPEKGQFAMYYQKKWWNLKAKQTASGDVVTRLDASVLQNMLLKPVFGIEDPRTDKRIDFVGGSRGTRELQRRVDSGDAVLAIAMHPTSMEELLEVSDAGQIMPPKSTWFEPKLRDGLLSHWI